MKLEISRASTDAILAEAARSPDVEVCGLLLGHGDRVDAIAPCRNVAEDPARSFEIDPRALIAAHRTARSGGPAVLGHYHSHPGGVAAPSPRDAANAVGDGMVWLIVGSGTLTAWRSDAPGRFVPLDVTCADGC